MSIRAAGLAIALVLGLAVAALAGCGDEDDAAAQTSSPAAGGIELSISYDDGAGTPEVALLTCRGNLQRAGGFLRDAKPVSALCATARSIKQLLTTPAAKDRACTQLYGGPQTAQVSGTIDGVEVERRFTRTDGCEIADFGRAAGLLRP